MPAVAVLTAYGRTALASAIQGSYVPPLYLVLESNGSTVSASYVAGVTTIQTVAPVHLAGDTQLILGVGLPTQETVTFSAATGAGPTTYTLSAATAYAHAAGDPACRLPLTSDTMAQVVSEIQYDPTYDPNLRVQSVGGYSTGVGQWTMQFFVSGIEASAFLMTGGLADANTVGQGNLHAHFAIGINHVYNALNGGVDLEIDVPIQL